MDQINENQSNLDLEEPKKPKSIPSTSNLVQGKFKLITKIIIYLIVFFVVLFLIFSSSLLMSDQDSPSWIYKIPIIGQIKHLAESADKKLKGENRDQINVLLLGMGGKRHEGAYLTDTIMLAILEPSTKKVALLSFPRDLTVPVAGMGWRKINNINAYAEVELPGSGGLAVSQALGDTLGVPIDYYLRVDFEGFVNIIDEIGKIEIEVENTLEDYKYPIFGMEEAEPYEDRFEHLYIPAGRQKMDGELALKYARSRHAAGVEGSDFARARRQQKIILAVKKKMLNKYILFKPRLISKIINEFAEHLSTNFKIWEAVKLWGMFKDINQENIITKVLDNSPNGLLKEMIAEDGAYILYPRSGDYAEIEYLVNNIFSDAPRETRAKVTVEKASVEVRNGTWINGLASQRALDLEKYGFNIIRIGNSSKQNFQKSVIYDLSFGEKIDSLTILKEKTGANVSFELPEWLKEDITKDLAGEKNPEQPDFILILGQDADDTSSGTANPEL